MELCRGELLTHVPGKLLPNRLGEARPGELAVDSGLDEGT
jgi:hypothetical protein